MIILLSLQGKMFQYWSGFLGCFFASVSVLAYEGFTPLDEPSAFLSFGKKAPLAEWSSLGWMLRRGLALTWKGLGDHPLLWSSMDIQAILCGRGHQCHLLFPECTKLYQTGHFWCFPATSDGCVMFLQPKNGQFKLHHELFFIQKLYVHSNSFHVQMSLPLPT